ncbi:MAG: sugar ABC transporter permease [Chloroflexota bacterium]
MAQSETAAPAPLKPLAWVVRILVSLVIPIITFIVLWQVFLFLRDSNAPKLVIAIVAILWGVGGVAVLFYLSNWIVERLPAAWRTRIQPFIFVGPALVMLTWFLALPTLRTFYQSFFNASATQFVGLDNYQYAFTNPLMLEAFRNNLLWLVFGTGLSVVSGLLIAVLADRSKFERVAKSLIFLPMAISFVGAGIIWKFIYAYQPQGREQIGLLNAIVTGFGGDPVNWITQQPWNTFFLIIVFVWLQTGFAMVLLSAALKGVPGDLLEAARIDGANEFQIFFRIIIPTITGTIVTVTTTVIIATLKVFDIVYVMASGGQYGTDVIANEQYKQFFRFGNFGTGSAIAIVLLIVTIPVMIYNLRQFRERKAF